MVYEDSQIFNTFFTFQIRQRIGLAITDANRRGNERDDVSDTGGR